MSRSHLKPHVPKGRWAKRGRERQKAQQQLHRSPSAERAAVRAALKELSPTIHNFNVTMSDGGRRFVSIEITKPGRTLDDFIEQAAIVADRADGLTVEDVDLA